MEQEPNVSEDSANSPIIEYTGEADESVIIDSSQLKVGIGVTFILDGEILTVVKDEEDALSIYPGEFQSFRA